MPSTDSPLARFRQAYFGPIDQYLAWHDGYHYQTDLSRLDALAPAERSEAAAELLAALRAGTADARAVIGLGHLQCEEALPLLHYLLGRAFASLYALGAIARISPAGLYQPQVAELLVPKTDTYQLIDLLMGLREYFTLPQLGPAVRGRVFALLASPDYLVRYHALDTLRRLYGLQTAEQQRHPAPNGRQHDELFNLIREDKKPANYRRAQQLFLTQLLPAERAALTIS